MRAPAPGLPILFVMPHLAFGGAERLASRIARHLSCRGRAVHLAVLGTRSGEDDAAGWFAPVAAGVERLDPDEPDLAGRLAALAARVGAAVAVLIGLSRAFPALPALREIHPDLRLVSFQFNEHEPSDEHRRFAPFIDLIVTEGEGVARTLVNLGVAEDRLATIPSGPDLSALTAGEAAASPDTAILAGLARPAVGFVGRMDPVKGPFVFVDLCARLRERSVSLVMAGDGPAGGEVRAALLERDLAERCLWLGRVSDEAVPWLYRRLDVVVVPSLIDGRPLVVQEAQACGAAVVASRVGSIPDLIDDGESGRLCRPGDVEDFASAVGQLLDDEALRTRLAAMGRVRVTRSGGLAASLDAYEAAIVGRPVARPGRARGRRDA